MGLGYSANCSDPFLLLLGLFLWLWSSLLWLLFARKRASLPFGLNIPQGPLFLHKLLWPISHVIILGSTDKLPTVSLEWFCRYKNFILQTQKQYNLKGRITCFSLSGLLAGFATSPWCPADTHSALLQPVSLALEMCQLSVTPLAGLLLSPDYFCFCGTQVAATTWALGTPAPNCQALQQLYQQLQLHRQPPTPDSKTHCLASLRVVWKN